MKKNLMMTAILFFVVSTGIVFASGQSETAVGVSDEVIKLKLGHDAPTAHPYQEGALYFAQRVSELTDGKVEISVFPGGQLGDELSMLDSLRLGDLDFSFAAAPNAATHVKEFGLFSVSYLFKSQEHFVSTMIDPKFTEMIKGKVISHGLGFHTIGFLTAGLRNVYNNDRPINNIKDLENLKMRVMAANIESEVWTTLGTKPVSIPFGDIYSALQTGLIQGAEGSVSSYYSAKHYELAPYYALTGHQWLATTLNISDSTWEELPGNIQEKILIAAKDLSEFQINYCADVDAEMLEEMQEKYSVQVSNIDIEPMMNALGSLQDSTAEKLGMTDVLFFIREKGKNF